MASHGVARTTRNRTEEQRKQDLDKIEKYRNLEQDIRARVAQSNYAIETFQLASKLLKLNPEYYTIWNVRRRCLISGLLSKPSASSSQSTASSSGLPTNTKSTSSADASSSSLAAATPPDPAPPKTGQTGTTLDPQDENDDLPVLQAELQWTIPLLLEFPKCYWIWNYRLWVLDQAIERLPPPTSRRVWEEELGLVGKMLTKDRRNFHAWDYRRHLVSKLESAVLNGKSMVEPEFEYTTKMIHVDLSNFSAWHNRSMLIRRLPDERGADDEARQEFLDKELSLVREALNVGPEDQSLWYYHQFLVLNLVGVAGGKSMTPNFSVKERARYVRREIMDIKDLLEDYDDVKWIYEALIEYTIALAELEKREVEADERADLRKWLDELQKLDPMRKGRWGDLEKECRLKDLQ